MRPRVLKALDCSGLGLGPRFAIAAFQYGGSPAGEDGVWELPGSPLRAAELVGCCPARAAWGRAPAGSQAVGSPNAPYLS